MDTASCVYQTINALNGSIANVVIKNCIAQHHIGSFPAMVFSKS